MNMIITMKLVCVFSLSCVTTSNASSFMGEDDNTILANPNIRGLLTKKCSDAGSSEEYGGDCSATPTYCGSEGFGSQPAQDAIVDDFWNQSKQSCNDCGGFWPTTQPANCHDINGKDLTGCGAGSSPRGNVVNCRCEGSWLDGDEIIPVEYSDEARTCFDRLSYEWMGQSLQTRCSEGVLEDFPDWCRSDYLMKFGGCSGGCSGTNNCLNLDFHCAEGEYCEMSCTGQNSCEGLTMYCPDNQVCLLQCSGEGSCVNAEVVCGKGTVAQSDQYNHGCVLADTADDCDKPIGKVYLYSLYKYEIMPVSGNIGTSKLGGTGTNGYGAIFELNIEHSNELLWGEEMTVSVFRSYDGENECTGDAFDSSEQTVTIIDGSFLQDVGQPANGNAKISRIEVTFDDVFEANIISSSNADGGDGSSRNVISLCIRVETTDGTHMFDKIDTAITQAIELNGKIETSKLGVANFDTDSTSLALADGTLKVEGTPAPYMCSEDGANDSGAVVIGSTMNICVPDDKQFKVDYIKDVTCSNGFDTFSPFENTDGTTGASYTIGDGASGEMIGIEIKAEYLPANSGTSLFECSGVIVYSYTNGERRLTHRELQEPTTTEEAETEFSLTIMITNEDPTLDSAGTKKMANIPVFTMIVTASIFQSAMMLMNQL